MAGRQLEPFELVIDLPPLLSLSIAGPVACQSSVTLYGTAWIQAFCICPATASGVGHPHHRPPILALDSQVQRWRALGASLTGVALTSSRFGWWSARGVPAAGTCVSSAFNGGTWRCQAAAGRTSCFNQMPATVGLAGNFGGLGRIGRQFSPRSSGLRSTPSARGMALLWLNAPAALAVGME